MPNLIIDAGPGTAKTYTLIRIPMYLRATNKEIFLRKNRHTEEQLAIWKWAEDNIHNKYTNPPSFLYAAYNTSIVDEVRPQVPDSKQAYGVDVRTIHGAGYRSIHRRYGYVRMNGNRGTSIVEGITGQNFYRLKDRFEWLSALRFIEKLKEELLPPTEENLQKMKDKYDGLANMVLKKDTVERIKTIVPKMQQIDRSVGIEYIDQLWLPLFFQKSPIYDIGLIDECQDLSPAKLKLMQTLCKHLIFTGDNNQAINAFAGADPYSFDRIRKTCQAELPLRTSFRNPPNIIRDTNAIIATPVVGKPGRPMRGTKTEDGIEEKVTFDKFHQKLDNPYSNNMIVCRYNAPLIQCCLKLYKQRIPASIEGKQLPEQLVSIVKQRKAVDLDDLEHKIQSYEDFSCKNVKPHIAEAIRDRMDCIRMVINECNSLEDFEDTLKSMFKPKKNQDHVQLRTIHKSKGTERPKVFILFPPVESEYATTPEQKQQELNLKLVAITRTSQDLYWIGQ
jgi:superfamily I DNA/RNA helicase